MCRAALFTTVGVEFVQFLPPSEQTIFAGGDVVPQRLVILHLNWGKIALWNLAVATIIRHDTYYSPHLTTIPRRRDIEYFLQDGVGFVLHR